jgi:hypothetical protein
MKKGSEASRNQDRKKFKPKDEVAKIEPSSLDSRLSGFS